MENYSGYTQLDFLLTKFIRENPKLSDLEWNLVSEENLKKLTIPSSEFNKKVLNAYSTFAYEDEIKGLQEVSVYFVFGNYIRKDYYSKNKFDEKTDYFYTMYVTKKTEKADIIPAKFVINQREYKSWLIDMLEKGERYKSSLEVKERSNKLQQIFKEASNLFNSKFKPKDSDNDTDLEELF